MFRNETQPEDHIERSMPLPTQPTLPDAEVQRKRMLIALGILLVALAAVILKDWDFWFPPAGEVHEAIFHTRSRATASTPATSPAAPARDKKPPPSAPHCPLCRWKSSPGIAT